MAHRGQTAQRHARAGGGVVKRLIAAALLTAALLAPAPAQAVTLVCMNRATTDSGHTVSLKCTQGPGSQYRLNALFCDVTGRCWWASGSWKVYGVRASVHSTYGYWNADGGVIVDTRAAS